MKKSSLLHKLAKMAARSPGFIVAGGTALRALGINESLWFDEAFTARLVTLSPAAFVKGILSDSAPPGWPILEYMVTRILGTTEAALRAPALALGALIIYLVYRISLAVENDRVPALLAAAFTALLPVGLYFSVEARQYNLLAAGVLLALLGCIENRAWMIVAGAIAAIYAQNVGVIYVGAMLAGYAMFSPGKGKARRLILMTVPIGAAVAPWIPFLLEQAKAVGSSFWLPGMTAPQLLAPLATMIMGWRIPESVQIPVYVVGMLCTLLGVYAARRWLLTRQGIMLLLIFVGAPLALGALSAAWRNIYLPRAILPSALLVPVFWASAGRNAPVLNSRQLAGLLNGVLIFCAFWFAAPPGRTGRIDMRVWFAPIGEGWQQGAIIYHGNEANQMLALYYLPDKPSVARPNEGSFMSLPEGVKESFGLVSENFHDVAAGACRVWLVFSGMPTSTAGELAEAEDLKRVSTMVRYREADHLWQGIYLFDKGESGERRSVFNRKSPS